jgi:hypothetical protein
VLFETLAGRPPFVASDPRQIALCHRREAPPDMRQIRFQVSREIGELVRRMLAEGIRPRWLVVELLPGYVGSLTVLDLQKPVTIRRADLKTYCIGGPANTRPSSALKNPSWHGQ